MLIALWMSLSLAFVDLRKNVVSIQQCEECCPCFVHFQSKIGDAFGGTGGLCARLHQAVGERHRDVADDTTRYGGPHAAKVWNRAIHPEHRARRRAVRDEQRGQ